MNTPLLVIAKQELLLATRSRWMQIFTTVFAILSLAVAASGYILSGGRGVQDFARTSVSLLQLVTFIVPLAALVIGVLSIGAERGYAEVLFSQPVSRTTVAIGQMLGIGLALVAAEAVGFGAAGLVIFSNAGGEGLGAYVWLARGCTADRDFRQHRHVPGSRCSGPETYPRAGPGRGGVVCIGGAV